MEGNIFKRSTSCSCVSLMSCLFFAAVSLSSCFSRSPPTHAQKNPTIKDLDWLRDITPSSLCRCDSLPDMAESQTHVAFGEIRHFHKRTSLSFIRALHLFKVMCEGAENPYFAAALIHGLTDWSVAHQCFHGNKVPASNSAQKRMKIKMLQSKSRSPVNKSVHLLNSWQFKPS